MSELPLNYVNPRLLHRIKDPCEVVEGDITQLVIQFHGQAWESGGREYTSGSRGAARVAQRGSRDRCLGCFADLLCQIDILFCFILQMQEGHVFNIEAAKQAMANIPLTRFVFKY
ncbi:hypothetical protein RHSIM_Rhsim08G0096800 [Rhododendron simsii]|uniref:Uncharacterized protein n=1 Tax=Rhododendron simsii TaxID=118357 RepID=A0A834LGV3_RHOSS|nr:hypothetical protein RHSIM_Rhsim08G0096800 [Rhododendron simsii]